MSRYITITHYNISGYSMPTHVQARNADIAWDLRNDVVTDPGRCAGKSQTDVTTDRVLIFQS